MQDLEHAAVREIRPYQVSFAWTLLQPTWEQQILLMKAFDNRAGRANASESLEEESQGILHLFVRIEHRAAIRAVNQTHRQRALQLASPRLVQDAAL